MTADRFAVMPQPPSGLPRILPTGPMLDHTEHLARFGPLPAVHSRSGRSELIDAVERSGLRGRGGAGFPTARKLRAVAGHGRHAVVVANGAEGEPASHKDAVLLTGAPHLVIDGAIVAARAVRADEVIIVVDRENPSVRDAVARAVTERDDGIRLRVVGLPNRYVAGEETAVVNFLNGGPAKPTFVPPRPFERGVRGRPTLVQNVETLANLALIARFGVDWFHGLGPLDEPGSMLVTVSGAVARPGVYELALGTSMPGVLDAVGGPTEELAAVLVGGYFGSWLPAAAIPGLDLTHRSMRAAGGSLGCGMIACFPARSCGVVESARIARYLAEETAGQCGPCVHGLSAIAGAVESVARGQPPRGTVRDLERWLGDVAGRGACHLPDAAVGFLNSARRVFASDFVVHEQGGRCTRDHSPMLPLPAPGARDWSWS
jgi:NADH:ubiquinone oxidoreductase subunit F (NADH-binding)